MKGSCAVLIVGLASGLLAAGCGGDDDSAADGERPIATQERTEATGTSTVKPPTETEPREDAGGAETQPRTTEIPDEAPQAVERCKQGVESAPQLSEDSQRQLKQLCEEAASGDVDAMRE